MNVERRLLLLEAQVDKLMQLVEKMSGRVVWRGYKDRDEEANIMTSNGTQVKSNKDRDEEADVMVAKDKPIKPIAPTEAKKYEGNPKVEVSILDSIPPAVCNLTTDMI